MSHSGRQSAQSFHPHNYELARMLTKVISPLNGDTSSFIKDAAHFHANPGKGRSPQWQHHGQLWCKITFFNNVPVNKALLVIRDKLEHDKTVELRTSLKIESIMELLTLCLKTTYYLYGGEYYQQNNGAAMGSLISPVVANIYKEFLEQEALETIQTKPDKYIQGVPWARSPGNNTNKAWHLVKICRHAFVF